MIQRIQTLFLAGVAIAATLLLFIPFQITNGENPFGINLIIQFKTPSVSSNIYVPFVVAVLSIVLSVFTIFKFKNRILQYKLANILMLLNIILLASFFLLNFYDGSVSYSFGSFIPVLGIACAFLAAHFIKKDEQLVRSADRIR